MPFLYSIEEHKKDKHKYAMITGFDEKASDLVVPAEIDGYTVEAIGNHAFSGRQDLISVSLPGTVKTLYGFAFHNCRKLKKIALFDSIDDYYDGVCRQCDSLKEVEITMIRGWYEVVRNFLADNDRTLRFILNLQTDPGTEAEPPVRSVLTFPEYVYDFNENTMARTIQFSIAGSGMFYRECVDRRSIDYRQYDRLFEKAVIDGGEISENIAIDRLLYPVELSDDFRKTYEEHVRANAESILRRLVEQYPDEPENLGTVKALLTYNNDDPDKEVLPGRAIDEAIKLSADKGFAQMSAVLMEAGRTLAEDQMFKL
ncbi:leucine-rich repeat protein [Butyrivibrio sp. FCS014]|uniref:leucine-rich repeat protein n=1 Tax=Butyrivibrio sp. FCS014 TaxID=1408304 RepID=UPI0004664036|nr:leucine-rich repeat protein [Butyrivibrio sp. FCS014]